MRKSAGPKERNVNGPSQWCFILHNASVPIGAWPPIRGTDLLCHLIALLLQTPPSSRSITIFVVPARDATLIFLIRPVVLCRQLLSFSLTRNSARYTCHLHTLLPAYVGTFVTRLHTYFGSMIVRESLENFPIQIFFDIKDPNYFYGNVKRQFDSREIFI